MIAAEADAVDWRRLADRLVGSGGAIVVSPDNRIVYGRRHNRQFVPASTAKVITAAAALWSLGPDYRFRTEFRLNQAGDLTVIGYGDPSLISEQVEKAARELRGRGLSAVHNLLLYDGYFAADLNLAGIGRTNNPYDASNAALAVNFNTVTVRMDGRGRIFSGEEETPLTPLAEHLGAKLFAGRQGPVGPVRMCFADGRRTGLLYAGELLAVFLNRAGVRVTGKPVIVNSITHSGKVVLVHRSEQTLREILRGCLRYSTNFTANQVYLTMGAEAHGPPARAAKSSRVMSRWLKGVGLTRVRLVEGSGLSRDNRASPLELAMVLASFQNDRDLLPERKGVRCKTGSLNNVSTLVGYLPCRTGVGRFAVMLNGDGANRDRIWRILELFKKQASRL